MENIEIKNKVANNGNENPLTYNTDIQNEIVIRRKILLSILFLCVFLTAKAQVNLLHSFQNSSHYPSTYLQEIIEPTDCFIVYNHSTSKICIYNQNFNLIKEVDLLPFLMSSPNPSESEVSNHVEYKQSLGKHLVNADDHFEFIICSHLQTMNYGSSEISQYYRWLIINENGEIIYQFNNNLYFFDLASQQKLTGIYKVGNQIVLCTSESTAYNVYSLGGNYNPSSMVTYTQPSGSLNPYPNPSRNTITLPYTLQSGEIAQLRIFNMSGQLLETFNIGSDFDKIELNVSNYAKGTYIYTYKGVSKKFVVR